MQGYLNEHGDGVAGDNEVGDEGAEAGHEEEEVRERGEDLETSLSDTTKVGSAVAELLSASVASRGKFMCVCVCVCACVVCIRTRVASA